MQLDGKTQIINGWLISGDTTKYGNSPIINIANIDGITYYENLETNTRGEMINEGEWFIMFSQDLKWRYENKDIMYSDYKEILALITEQEPKKYI